MSDPVGLLPPNSTRQEVAVEQATARLGRIPVPVADLWRAETCPDHLLGWLAWGLSVDIWQAGWDEATKRAVVARSVALHRQKGTPLAVETALGTLGFHTDLEEWFETGAAPHTFRVTAYGNDVFSAGFQIDERLLEEITRLIETVKPARAHFTLRIGETFSNNLTAKAGLRQRAKHSATLSPKPRSHLTDTRLIARSGLRQRAYHRGVLNPMPTPLGVRASTTIKTGLRQWVAHRANLTVTPRNGANYAK